MNKNFIFLDIKKKEKHMLKMVDTGEYYQASEHDLINKGEEIAISYQQIIYNIDITDADPGVDLCLVFESPLSGKTYEAIYQ